MLCSLSSMEDLLLLETFTMRKQLIELVKKHEVLYNTQRSEYKDLALKASAWEYIGSRLNMSGHQCKTIWGKLRNCFTNAMKRRRRNCKRNKKNTPWLFEKEMSFLMPFVEWKEFSKDNCTDTTAANNSDEENSKQSSYDEYNELQTTYIEQSPSGSDTNYHMNHSSNEHKIKKQKFNNGLMDDNVYINNSMDETDLFFLSMSQTIKRLPKIDQAKIKMNFHKMVFDAEEKHLKRNETVDYNSDDNDSDEIVIKTENN